VQRKSRKPVAEPQLVEFAYRVGQQVDADSERFQIVCLFDDRDVEAALLQSERRGQSADACPGDENRLLAHDSTVRDQGL
jgi:hypothetical protein